MVYKKYSFKKIINPAHYVKDEIKEIIRRIINKTNNFDIIDFGAGTGRLTIPLLKSGFKVVAADIDKNSLEQLKKNAKKIGKEKNLKIAKEIKKAKYYSYIVGCDILHHVNVSQYFQVFYKALDHNGKIIFSEPNAFHLFWWFFVIIFLNFNDEKGIVHCNFFSLSQKVKQAGFRDIKINGFGLFPPQMFENFKNLSRLNYLLGKSPFLKLFAYRLIIEASK